MAETPAVPVTPSAHAGGGDGGSIVSELRRMPPWGWLLIAGGAFVGYKLLTAGTNGTSATPAESTAGSTVGDTSGGGGDGAGASNPTTPSPPSGPTPPPPAQLPGGGSGGPPRGPTATPTPTPTPPHPSPPTYTVRQGDTLSGIGQRYGVSWEDIYNTNSAVIEQTAQQRSGHGSDHGTWIYPGEVLAIP